MKVGIQCWSLLLRQKISIFLKLFLAYIKATFQTRLRRAGERITFFLANKLFMIILIVIIVAIIKALFFTDFNLSVTKDKGKTKKTNIETTPPPPPRHMPGGSGGGFSKRDLL